MFGFIMCFALIAATVLNGGDNKAAMVAFIISAAVFYCGGWIAYVGTKLNDIYKLYGGIKIMENKEKIVEFEKWCQTCMDKNTEETEDPCNVCLTEPVNTNSHKPVNWRGR